MIMNSNATQVSPDCTKAAASYPWPPDLEAIKARQLKEMEALEFQRQREQIEAVRRREQRRHEQDRQECIEEWCNPITLSAIGVYY